MQIKLLKDVVSFIAGQNASPIVDLLYGTQNVNEFLIAKKLKVTINQARNILYKLGDEGLVSFVRKKDKKNGGWYTYFWTLDTHKSLHVLKNKLVSEINNLESQVVSKQAKQFYYCPNCALEMSEENALLHDFTCPECGEVFLAKDNSANINNLKKNIEDLKKKTELVDLELIEIEKNNTLVKDRKRKREEKKKKLEREIKRKERQKEREKLKPKKVPAKNKKSVSKNKKKRV